VLTPVSSVHTPLASVAICELFTTVVLRLKSSVYGKYTGETAAGGGGLGGDDGGGLVGGSGGGGGITHAEALIEPVAPNVVVPVGHDVQLEAMPPGEYVSRGHVVHAPSLPVVLVLPCTYDVLM